MSERGSFVVKVDVAEVTRLADGLGSLDAAAFGRVATGAVNTVAEQAFKDARQKMIAGISLTETYLDDRMTFTPATESIAPVATVTARKRHTSLTTYNAKQLTQPVKYPNGSFTAGKMYKNPRKAGAFLPWKPRTGDESRGIPVDMKGAGVSVEVTRGAPKPISYAFVIQGRNGNKLVVERVPGTKRKVEVLYGPSVYQLFRAALTTDFLENVSERLSKTVVTLSAEEIKKALP